MAKWRLVRRALLFCILFAGLRPIVRAGNWSGHPLNPGGDGCGASCGGPVDLSSAIDIIKNTDLSLRGNAAVCNSCARSAHPPHKPLDSFLHRGSHSFELVLNSDLVGAAATFDLTLFEQRRLLC